MKKMKYIILLLLMIIPILVKADMAAPMSSYKIRISNPNGANTYEWNPDEKEYTLTETKLNYDEVYNIAYEQIIDGELYGQASIRVKDENGWQTENYFGYIKLSDTSPLEVNIEDYKKETSVKYYVFDDTCYLYKGPSKIYGKIEPKIFIKKGTTIESNYYDEMWTYIEYNGVKGWVYKYTFNKGPYNEPAGMVYVNEKKEYNRKILTMKEIELYKSPKTDEKTDKTIPKGVSLDYIYVYLMEPFSPNYYVSYNGNYGWLKTEQEDYIITNIAYYTRSTLKIKNDDGLKMYISPNQNSEVLANIPKDTEVTSKYSLEESHSTPWYYINYNGTEGWLYINTYEDIEYLSNEENQAVEEIKEDLPEEIPEEEKTIIPKQEDDNVNDLIIYYLLGALIICLTAIVILLLVNKKKKSRKGQISKVNSQKEKKDETIPIKDDNI